MTEDGAKFYDRCQQILDELEAAELEIKQAQSIPTGTLRLELSIGLGKKYIAPQLPKFAAQYPDLKLDVFFSDRIVDMVEEGIDATVRVGLQFDYAEAMLEAAINSGGIIQAPQYTVAEAINDGQLQPILSDYASQLGKLIAIVYPQKRYLSAKVSVFVMFMTELMSDLKRMGIVN